MLQIPPELLEDIKDEIRSRCHIGESSWNYGEEDEDSMVGDFLGNLRTGLRGFMSSSHDFEWEIKYRKFRGRGNRPFEKKSGADAIISYEVTEVMSKIKTIKSIIFQAKKQGNTRQLKEQMKKMNKMASSGNFVMNCSPNGFFAEQIEESKRIADFLADDFLPCKTGIEGMAYDPIRKELRFEATNLIHYQIDLNCQLR